MSIRSYLFTVVLMTFITVDCRAQEQSAPQAVYNEQFKWTITIPENFTKASDTESKKLQEKGLKAVEDTFGEKIIDEVKTIFLYRNGNFNYIEANYQPFDVKADGDYDASCKNVREIVYQTFRTQLPEAPVDSASFREVVGGIQFNGFKVAIGLPDGKSITLWMFSRLFDTLEFVISITYVEEKQGAKILDAWRKSTFD